MEKRTTTSKQGVESIARRKRNRRGLPTGKVGLPPESLIHIGKRSIEKTRIAVMEYDEGQYAEKKIESTAEIPPLQPPPVVTWISVEGLHRVDVIEQIGNRFGVHPLIQEDILNTTQRPKIDDLEKYLFVTMKMLRYDEKVNEIHPEQISLIVGAGFLISFLEGDGNLFETVRERIRSGKGRVRKFGADYLAYCLIDTVVDNYFVILEKLAERIEFLEEELVTNPTRETLKLIHKIKTEMIFLRRSIWPLREVINSLARGETPLIKETTLPYLRDVYDHTIHCIDTMETYRDVISGMLDIYLSSVSNRLNEIMKVLTILATIFIPLTFLAGWYGMNFKNMPELEWRWGYLMVILIAIAVTVSMLLFFRRKKWL